MSEPKKIAILGAGPSGLTAIKCCKEVGLLPVCYERNGEPGGLWRFQEDDIEGEPSVMRNTIINTSKEMSAFSDFPPPMHFPNYMHNSKMYDYFMRYAEEFNLLKHIRYNMEVIRVEPTSDFDSTGRWTVSVSSTKTAAVTKEEFDGVLVCVGHHVYPKVPSFPGQELFKGSVTHTHSIKSCDAYKEQKVVVIGIGNSGVDAAVECTYVAEQVYLSTRKGSWILSRVGPKGQPFDISFITRRNNLLAKIFPFQIVCDQLEADLNRKFDHDAYNLRPKHRVLSAHPTINDALPNCVLSGRVIVKGDVERFVESGIVFAGDDGKVTEIDAVVLATGYHIKYPFLDQGLVGTEDNRIHLYKYSIPPQLKHPTLAIIGGIQPIGAIFPISEMQCRLFSQVMVGNLKLPSAAEMEKEIALKNEANAKRYVDSTRHTIQVDWIPFMDELASLLGAKPNFLKMAVTDPKLFWTCFNGPCTPYQYRLEGPHQWPGARDAILKLEERISAPLRVHIHEPRRSSMTGTNLFIFILLIVLFLEYALRLTQSLTDGDL